MAGTSIISTIGGTPAIWLDRLVEAAGVQGRILAKLDYLNPGFSKKDRAALGIIRAARSGGTLRPGQAVVEMTSGNMGTGLAIVCAQMGHPFIAVMSRGNSPERARMMRALGAKVVLVEQVPSSTPGKVSGADLARVDAVATRLTAAHQAFRADQFAHPGNKGAHQYGTAEELWSDSNRNVDVFVDFAGSGGTFAGTLTGLRNLNPQVRGYVVEPSGAAVLAGGDLTDPDHPIQGGGYGMPDLIQMEGVEIDGFIAVTGEEAAETTRDLARVEGVFAGYSAGANVMAALALLAGPETGKTIAVIICDSGMKYLSTDLWS